MSQLVSTVVHDDSISEYTIVTLVAIGAVTALFGLVSLVSPHMAGWADDVPSLALFFI